MAYPGSFLRLVIIGDQFGDVWNTTLSLVPTAVGEIISVPVDQATADTVRELVRAWFVTPASSDGVGFYTQVKLHGIKLNRIDASGHYQDDEAIESMLTSPVSGVDSGGAAPQLTTAATLRTAVPRGRGSMGRMFLPPSSAIGTMSITTGQLSVAGATQVGDGAVALIRDLNTHFDAYARVGVASSAGSGRFEHVTKVTVGRVIDTMRSRRSALTEDPVEIPV